MLRYSLAACLLLSGSASLWADFPDGVLEERQRDFGVVPRGQQLVHYFRLVNNTDKPMRIYNVRVSCGCTSARALNMTIPPGQESAIWANMDGRRFLGHKAVTIYVNFDQPRREELRLVVQAYSREDIIFSSDGIDLGKVRQGDTKTASLNITFYNGSVKLSDATAESSFLAPDLKEIKRSASETVYQVSATVRGDTPPGLWFTDLWVKTTNPGAPKLRVPVTVEVDVVQPVQVAPKTRATVKTSDSGRPARSSQPAKSNRPEEPYRIFPVAQPEATAPPGLFPSFSLLRR